MNDFFDANSLSNLCNDKGGSLILCLMHGHYYSLRCKYNSILGLEVAVVVSSLKILCVSDMCYII